METIHETLTLPNDCYTREFFKNNAAFFDIETTGFSAKNSSVYLIGLVVRREETMEIFQFFAENSREEKDILTAFQKAVSLVSVLICYNGLSFDIPFLKHREERYHLSFSWENYQILDLYQETKSFLNLLHLPDKKQKTLETFWGIHRKDVYSGRELISVYREYEKQPTEESKSLLLLHNYEDILGMTKLLPFLSYLDFFSGEAAVTNAILEETLPFGADSPVKELQVTLKASLPFPAKVTVEKEMYRLTFRENYIYLFVPVLEGELFFYYDNYKDYYYLPAEDMAVHKSLASFVDKSHRKKATPSTCYTKRSGLFLPQKEDWFPPCFYPGKKEKSSWFPLGEEFLGDGERLLLYVKKILSLFL